MQVIQLTLITFITIKVMEIIFTLLYALLIGFFEVFKKISVKKSNESSILVMLTSTAFLLSLIWIPFGVAISIDFILIFALKGFIIAFNWYITLKILKSADLSIVAITNILSTVLSFIIGIVVFNEVAVIWQIIGSILIIGSVALINIISRNNKGKITKIQLILLLVCALISSGSSVIDKYTTTYLNPQQTQFWFLLFVSLFSWIFFIIDAIKNKTSPIKKRDFKNFWIYFAGACLFFGDFMLFNAYKVPNSQLITISVISKLKIIVTVLAGIIIFKEKNIWKKLLLTLLIVIGAIMIAIC